MEFTEFIGQIDYVVITDWSNPRVILLSVFQIYLRRLLKILGYLTRYFVSEFKEYVGLDLKA